MPTAFEGVPRYAEGLGTTGTLKFVGWTDVLQDLVDSRKLRLNWGDRDVPGTMRARPVTGRFPVERNHQWLAAMATVDPQAECWPRLILVVAWCDHNPISGETKEIVFGFVTGTIEHGVPERGGCAVEVSVYL